MKPNDSFESFGRFYVGHVAATKDAPRRQRRRVLVFVTQKGVLGASSNFSRTEAANKALKAETGQLPLPNAKDPQTFFTSLLATRGFPVRGPEDFVDDETAAVLQREFVK